MVQWIKVGSVNKVLGLWRQLLKNVQTAFILGMLLTGWHSQREFRGEMDFHEVYGSECSVVKFPSWEAMTIGKEISYVNSWTSPQIGRPTLSFRLTIRQRHNAIVVLILLRTKLAAVPSLILPREEITCDYIMWLHYLTLPRYSLRL